MIFPRQNKKTKKKCLMNKIGNKYQKPIIVLNSIWIHKSKSNKRLHYKNNNLRILNINQHTYTHTQEGSKIWQIFNDNRIAIMNYDQFILSFIFCFYFASRLFNTISFLYKYFQHVKRCLLFGCILCTTLLNGEKIQQRYL